MEGYIPNFTDNIKNENILVIKTKNSKGLALFKTCVWKMRGTRKESEKGKFCLCKEK
jgi:hypothetical protein